MPLNGVPFSGPQVAPFNLSAVSVDPSTHGAEPGQPIVFGVKYESDTGTMPVTADVDIDDVLHPMTLVSGTKAGAGLEYHYTTSDLSEGDHHFVFMFNDASGLQTFEEHPFSVTPIVLLKSAVSPTSGTASTEFTFSTVYHGPASPAPTAVDVVVNGVTHPLFLVSGTPATGATYSVTMTLPVGAYTFAFYGSDGPDMWGDPEDGATYSGLTVSATGGPVVPATIVGPPPQGYPYPYDAG